MSTGNLVPALLAIGLFAALPAKAEASPPRIDDIGWHRTSAYCTFSRAKAEIKKNDPESWRFVLLVDRTSEDGRASIETAYMKIDGILRELRFDGVMTGEQSESRRYMTYGDDPVRVEVELKPGKRKKGAKLFNYTGTIKAIRSNTETVLEFKGDCGH